MVNAKNMRRLANRIERHPDTYYQGSWYLNRGDCGTAACIAGHAAALSRKRGLKAMFAWWGLGAKTENIKQVGADWLGLTPHEAGILFLGVWTPPSNGSVPEALRRYAEDPTLIEKEWTAELSRRRGSAQ